VCRSRRTYREAVGDAFERVDFAQLHKLYGLDPKVRGAQRRYSPPMVTSTQVTVVSGDPDLARSARATSSART
jgi:hypothetical protein